MTAAEWGRVRIVFEEALRASPTERAALLASGIEEPAVVAEVESLLQVYEESPDFLEGVTPHLPDGEDAASLAGRRLGPWLLVREIGRGGMGLVWEANRADREYEQRVAIKLLPFGSLSALAVARFREERQILARLSHPGIARLLDGGTTEDGSPYLAMEYVEGQLLDAWCADHNPSVRERVKLFQAICEAVDYAHRRLVIHRDLKPANILLLADGTPKLLDFGIAKLLDTESGLSHGTTEAANRLLTPQYASPEQVRGEAVTTATDIYSLGVILYLLLTGESPYPASRGDSLAMMRAICEGTAAPPSSVAGNLRELRGELDAIVLQCLRRDPEERYSSVAALADDLTAWLESRPVAAHAPSRRYRAVKFIRRNKFQSAAAAVTLLAVLAGSGISLWYARYAYRERQQAETRFNQVRQLAHAVIFDIHDAIQDLPGATPARRILIEKALHYLKELEATGATGRELDLEIAAGYARVGAALANLGRGYLGDTEAARESVQKARSLAWGALRSSPGDAEAQRILEEADRHLARLSEWQGDNRGAKELLRESVTLLWQLYAQQPERGRLRALALVDQLEILALDEDWAAVHAAAPEVVKACEEVVARDPDPAVASLLMYAYAQMAEEHKRRGDLATALEVYRKSQRVGADTLAKHPGLVRLQMEFSFTLLEAGWLEHSLGKHREAIDLYIQALGIQARVADADPQDWWSRTEYAKLLNTAASAYEAAGRRQDAIRMLTDAAQRLEQAWLHDPKDEDTRYHLGWVWSNLGDLYVRGGLPLQATSCYQRARETLQSADPAAQDAIGHSQVANLANHLTAQLALARSGKPLEVVPIP